MVLRKSGFLPIQTRWGCIRRGDLSQRGAKFDCIARLSKARHTINPIIFRLHPKTRKARETLRRLRITRLGCSLESHMTRKYVPLILYSIFFPLRMRVPRPNPQESPTKQRRRKRTSPGTSTQPWYLTGFSRTPVSEGHQGHQDSRWRPKRVGIHVTGNIQSKQVRRQRDHNRNECRPDRSTQLVRGRVWV